MNRLRAGIRCSAPSLRAPLRGLRVAAKLVALIALLPLSAQAQITPPNYDECRLIGIFPAGGKLGESVTVELQGSPKVGLQGAKDIIIDGAPGISVKDVKNLSPTLVQATFIIAADAAPGKRCVRVLNERSGLTNMLYFSVGTLPEAIEREPNNDAQSAQQVALPVVVNGRVNPAADVDCFRFSAKKGQHLVAVVLAHALDSHGQFRNFGIADANLELLDERGRTVASAGDTLGLDPLIEFTVPADGNYIARVTLENYDGYPQATYRLALGDMALPTSIFPPGGKRGSTVDVELSGPNVPPGTRRKLTIPNDSFPFDSISSGILDLPFVRGDFPEILEAEPNNKPEQANSLEIPAIANGRIDAPGDVDWYRVKLNAGQKVKFETTAQRFLRSPIDTRIEVYDSAGKKLAENDDGFAIDYISTHDYRVMDSRMVFTAPSAGEYRVRVSDQSGTYGPRAVYRLSASVAEPDFELTLYPDAVPVWGPGTTAAMLVKVDRWDNLDGDIALSVEGLPTGWSATSTIARSYLSQPRQEPSRQFFLTLTAPADAKVGDIAPFRIVGKAEINGKSLERYVRPVTLYYSSDIGFFRYTPQARAVVAKPQTPWLSTRVKALTAKQSGTLEVPFEVHGEQKLDKIEVSADLATNGVATALAPPQSVAMQSGKGVLSLKLPDNIKPGHYGIVVSLRWRADIRVGMPGPCTPLIALEVTEAKGK